ncbi:MAG: flavodoxin family protein [Gammaproteobacteria bacterium]|nr:flavodoxin family protein [Gammaproteobacteria bacterium]
MAHKFCDILKEKGAEIKYVELNKLNYRGCQACDACKKSYAHCVLKDDLAETLETAKESDVIVLASPIYFGEVTAQLKGFIDRTYSYIVPDYQEKIGKESISRLKPNTRFVMIISQKSGEEILAIDDIYPKYKTLFEMFLGIKEMLLIRGCNLVNEADAINNKELMKQIQLAAMEFIV